MENVTFKVILDTLLTGLIALPSLILLLGVEPFHRGFYCDDQTIAYPYKKDTVTIATAVAVGIILNVAVVVIGEILAYRCYLKNKEIQPHRLDKMYNREYSFFGKTVHSVLATLYCVLGAFTLGLAINTATTDVIKYAGGRLRPHFLAVCEPDWTKIACNEPSTGMPIYIEDENICRGDEDIIKEARLSHPSGHSSFSMYSMVFLALYLQSRFHWQGSRVLRAFLQVIFIYLGLYVCLSRVSDYKHHWSDVLAGGALGVLVAFLAAFYLSNIFPRCRARLDECNLHRSDMKLLHSSTKTSCYGANSSDDMVTTAAQMHA